MIWFEAEDANHIMWSISWDKSQKSYFNVGAKGPELGDGNHNNIDNRYDLYHYDFNLYTLINEAFPCLNSMIDRCSSQNGIVGAIKMNCEAQSSTEPPGRGPNDLSTNWTAIFLISLVLVRLMYGWCTLNIMDKLGEHCYRFNRIFSNPQKLVLLQTFPPTAYLNLLLEIINSVLSDKSIKLNKLY